MDVLKLESFALKLKKLKRKGWTLRGLKNVESVADHSFSVALLSMALSEELGLKTEKCIKMALIHDLVESISGDITPHDNISGENKALLENSAMEELCSSTGMSWMQDLWREYSDGKTKESKLVHDLDKLDMVMQAIDYEKETGKDLSEFFTYTENKLFLEETKKLYRDIKNKKK